MTESAEKLLKCLNSINDIYGVNTFGIVKLHTLAEEIADIDDKKVRKEALADLEDGGYLTPSKNVSIWKFNPDPDKGLAELKKERDAEDIAAGLKKCSKIMHHLKTEIKGKDGLEEQHEKLKNIKNDLNALIQELEMNGRIRKKSGKKYMERRSEP